MRISAKRLISLKLVHQCDIGWPRKESSIIQFLNCELICNAVNFLIERVAPTRLKINLRYLMDIRIKLSFFPHERLIYIPEYDVIVE